MFKTQSNLSIINYNSKRMKKGEAILYVSEV